MVALSVARVKNDDSGNSRLRKGDMNNQSSRDDVAQAFVLGGRRTRPGAAAHGGARAGVGRMTGAYRCVDCGKAITQKAGFRRYRCEDCSRAHARRA